MTARDKFYFGRELYYEGLYRESIARLKDFLEDKMGWEVNKIEACKIIYKCFEGLNERDNGIVFLYRSFNFGEPRAEILCLIGWYFKDKGKYKEATFWFDNALRANDQTINGDFENEEYRGIIPLIELTFLCEKTGEREKAIDFHKKAKSLSPEHPSVKINDNYFSKLQ